MSIEEIDPRRKQTTDVLGPASVESLRGLGLPSSTVTLDLFRRINLHVRNSVVLGETYCPLRWMQQATACRSSSLTLGLQAVPRR